MFSIMMMVIINNEKKGRNDRDVDNKEWGDIV